MGFINKISGFFSNSISESEGSGEEKGQMNFENLQQILIRKRKELNGEICGNNLEMHNQLSVVLDKLEKDLNVLSEVDLSEKRNNERIKQITDLGRKDYLVSANKLLKLMKNKENGINYLNGEMEKFMMSSVKSYHKATLLIGKEMENVFKDMRDIKEILRNFEKFNLSLFTKQENMDELLKMYDLKLNDEEEKLKISKELEKVKKILKDSKEDLIKIDGKIMIVKDCPEYKKEQDFIFNKEKKKSELKSTEFKINSLLNERILEKYVYLEKNSEKGKIAQQYIKNTVSRLMSDEDFKILEVLSDIQNSIRKNILNVKEPDKIIKEMEISKNSFLEYKEKILGLEGEIKKIGLEIDKFRQNRLNLNEMLDEKLRIENKIREDSKNVNFIDRKQIKIGKTIIDLNSKLFLMFEGYN